jgi:putative PIN family toxin of toxin-antitoxin system
LTWERRRAVYDCQVFLQAALSDRGPAAGCLRAADLGLVQLCISGAIWVEVADVLARPELRRRFARLTPPLIDAFLSRLREIAVVVDDVPPLFVYDRDPDDEPYINLAIAARAAYLVSRDRDLLDLRSRLSPDGSRLRELAPDLEVLDPVQFLAALG